MGHKYSAGLYLFMFPFHLGQKGETKSPSITQSEKPVKSLYQDPIEHLTFSFGKREPCLKRALRIDNSPRGRGVSLPLDLLLLGTTDALINLNVSCHILGFDLE